MSVTWWFEACTLALLKTRNFLKCYVLCTRMCWGDVSKRERTQDGCWPLAANAIKMTYWFPITSDTTVKDNNIRNVLGPRAPPSEPPGTGNLYRLSLSRRHIVRLFVDCVLWGFSVSALDVTGPCWMIYSRCWTPKDLMWTWQDKHLKQLWKIGQRKSKTRLTFHGKILSHICQWFVVVLYFLVLCLILTNVWGLLSCNEEQQKRSPPSLFCKSLLREILSDVNSERHIWYTSIVLPEPGYMCPQSELKYNFSQGCHQ